MMASRKPVLCIVLLSSMTHLCASTHPGCDGGVCQAASDDEDSAALLQTKDSRASLDGGRPCQNKTVSGDDSGMEAAMKSNSKSKSWMASMLTTPDNAGTSSFVLDPAYNPWGFCPLQTNAAREAAAWKVGGATRATAQKFFEYNAYVMTQGKAPVDPSTAWGITHNGPYGPWGMSWASLRQMGLSFVLLPTLLATGAGNRTEWFLQSAWTTCWNAAPLANGPMIFEYNQVAGDLADRNQKRGFYTATAPQIEAWFPRESLLFLDGAEHRGSRKLLESVGFAKAGDVNIDRVETIPQWSGCKPPSQGQVAELLGDVVMEQIWGEVPSGKAHRAMQMYLKFGAMTIFGKYMHDLLKPLGIAGQITQALEQVTDWAMGTTFATVMEKAMAKGISSPWSVPKRTLVDVVAGATMFAGIIGTTDMTQKCVAYQMQDKTHEKLFKEDPEKYLIELMRFDSAVTSFTKVLAVDTTFNLEGRTIEFAKGVPVQGTLATSNRDPMHWSEPDTFNPHREDLSDVLSWNGKASEVEAMNLETAPRYCPGYCLSLKVGAAVCARMMGSYDELKAAGKILANNGEVRCNNFEA